MTKLSLQCAAAPPTVPLTSSVTPWCSAIILLNQQRQPKGETRRCIPASREVTVHDVTVTFPAAVSQAQVSVRVQGSKVRLRAEPASGVVGARRA